jgi:hypothetical protein
LTLRLSSDKFAFHSLEDDVSEALSQRGNPIIYNAIYISASQACVAAGREGTQRRCGYWSLKERLSKV